MSRCADDGRRSTTDRDDAVTSWSVSTERRLRRSSPLLSVLLASVGDHRDDDVNAQSILEDHVLRVWDETAASASTAAPLHDQPAHSPRASLTNVPAVIPREQFPRSILLASEDSRWRWSRTGRIYQLCDILATSSPGCYTRMSGVSGDFPVQLA